MNKNTTTLLLQDPTSARKTMLDTLADVAEGAERGGGVFAFASARGISTFLRDPSISSVASADFRLVVGVDALTDIRALDVLRDLSMECKGLTTRVMLHDTPSLFHPKFAWFVRDESLHLVVGSGNLTLGGLVANYEAFSVSSIRGKDAKVLEAKIHRELKGWASLLVAPDDPQARARAARNFASERNGRKSPEPGPRTPDHAEVPAPTSSAEVYLFEISRNTGGTRWQLDVGKQAFTEFFGGGVGQNRHIVIQQVNADGSVGPEEPPRLLFGVDSRNYRMEAAAGKGRPYPTEGRPIAIFVRTAAALFHYQIVWPDEGSHSTLRKLLKERGTRSRAEAMSRLTTTLERLNKEWPESPF